MTAVFAITYISAARAHVLQHVFFSSRSPLRRPLWYNYTMIDFGKGPTLKEASPWLRDDKTRIERILTVAEINSVVEGLPPFTEETREQIRTRLSRSSEPAPEPTE